jgi:hypothetical protein
VPERYRGVADAKPRDLDAFDRLLHDASLPARSRAPTALKPSLRGF